MFQTFWGLVESRKPHLSGWLFCCKLLYIVNCIWQDRRRVWRGRPVKIYWTICTDRILYSIWGRQENTQINEPVNQMLLQFLVSLQKMFLSSRKFNPDLTHLVIISVVLVDAFLKWKVWVWENISVQTYFWETGHLQASNIVILQKLMDLSLHLFLWVSSGRANLDTNIGF